MMNSNLEYARPSVKQQGRVTVAPRDRDLAVGHRICRNDELGLASNVDPP